MRQHHQEPSHVVYDVWHGCYRHGWQGILVPEAYAHPAKMARDLIQRIYAHAAAEGWVHGGEYVVVTDEIRQDIQKEIDSLSYQQI